MNYSLSDQLPSEIYEKITVFKATIQQWTPSNAWNVKFKITSIVKRVKILTLQTDFKQRRS